MGAIPQRFYGCYGTDLRLFLWMLERPPRVPFCEHFRQTFEIDRTFTDEKKRTIMTELCIYRFFIQSFLYECYFDPKPMLS